MKNIFNFLKGLREKYYFLWNALESLHKNNKNYNLNHAFNKILNESSERKEDLKIEQKRYLRHIMMCKLTKIVLVKRKVLSKWHAWTIPRKSYLFTSLRSVFLRHINEGLNRIRERSLWSNTLI